MVICTVNITYSSYLVSGKVRFIKLLLKCPISDLLIVSFYSFSLYYYSFSPVPRCLVQCFLYTTSSLLWSKRTSICVSQLITISHISSLMLGTVFSDIGNKLHQDLKTSFQQQEIPESMAWSYTIFHRLPSAANFTLPVRFQN